MTVIKEVNLAVYKKNLETIVKTMAPTRVMAVVKADGYGHGMVETARAATEVGIPILGVLDVESGIELRKGGISTTAFAWLHSPSTDFATAIRADIELSASNLLELNRIALAPGVAKVHLKLDSGLSRNGASADEWPELVKRAVSLDKQGEIDLVAIWTHLSGTSLEVDRDSLAKFDAAASQAEKLGFAGYRHAAASPASFAIPESRYELVRIGVSAFGTSPIDGRSAESFGLSSPMSLKASVLSPGVISIGFLHGYFSQLAGKASVLINGNHYSVEQIGPLASKIEVGEYQPGDEVFVFGGSAIPAEEICALVGTVTDELFTGIKANSVTYSN